MDEKIESGLSSVLYHFTKYKNALSILKDNEFKLSKGSRPGEDKNFYYFSTSRAKFGGYHINQRGVIFVLDGTALGKKYKGEPVNYFYHYQNMFPSAPAQPKEEQDEMEDRIISTKPVIENAVKYIKEIHICANSAQDEPLDYNTSQIVDLAQQYGIQVYVYCYGCMLDWMALNKKKALHMQQSLKEKISAKYLIILS